MTVSPDQLRALSLLLDEALDLAAEDRAGWLDRLPADQAQLRPLLEEMLASQGEGDAQLPSLPEYSERELDALAPGDAPDLIENAVVGPYRLLRELGRGGMGSVWLAERVDGTLKRQVALKLPHSSLPQRQLAERFARERDILAALTHPHIARLYDAGVTDAGRPYLALEFVEGEPITAYADAHRLAIGERLALFLQVLSALQYAHGQQVVHRDIKPSNILVTADGEVKLLDFGIAKLLTDGEARETELTRVGGRALTPQYASPEQILGQPLGVASDVYSLGVVLYELLTGSLPYRLKRDSRGALEDAILAVDPTRPSQTEVLLGNAEVRASTVRKLSFALRGDLDTIILKALKKQATERYATAQDFADDLRRHLAGEPVAARPDSVAYRARKFLRRNWLAVGAAAAVFAALAVGLGVALWQAQVARTEAQTAKAVQSFLLDIFQANSSNQADPQKARNTTARELLDIGAKKVDGGLADAPEAKLQIFDTLGELYLELGLNAQAADLQRKRAKLAESTFGHDSRQEAAALMELATALSTKLDDPEWEKSLKAAEDILDHLGDADSLLRARLQTAMAAFYEEKDLPKAILYADGAAAIVRRYAHGREFAQAMTEAASVRLSSGDWAMAKSRAAEGIAGVEAAADHANADLLPNLYYYRGYAEQWMADFAAAGDDYRRAWELSRSLGGDDHPDTIGHLADYGGFLASTGRLGEGLAKLEGAIQALQRSGAIHEPLRVSAMFDMYGNYLGSYGRTEEALQSIDRAIDALANAGNSPRLAQILTEKAELLVDVGRLGDARTLLGRAHAIEQESRGSAVDWGRDQLLVQVKLYLAQGKLREAGDLILRLFPGDQKDDPLSVHWFNRHRHEQMLALAKRNAPAALASALEVIDAVERHPGRIYYATAEFSSLLTAGNAYRMLDRPSEAETNLRQAMQLAMRLFDRSESLSLAETQIALAGCLLDEGKADEARPLAASAAAIHARHVQIADRHQLALTALLRRLH